MRICITGCGRSGTKYVSEVCRALGKGVLHERRGSDGRSCWHLAMQPDRRKAYDMIIHVVRKPWKMVRSVSKTFAKTSMQFISEHTSVPDNEINLHNAMIFWYEWNDACEKLTDNRFRIEHDIISPRFCDCIGVPYQPALMTVIPTDTNTREGDYKKITKQEILTDMQNTDKKLYDEIMEKARYYGYDE